ncbi:MAG TPA: hypothetical protein VFC63_17005 [Blastocatellia bacterium]|nr:hypothetical protein [Blastocatellia bacterium]
MNFCKRRIFVDKLSDDELAKLELQFKSRQVRSYTGSISEQSALKAYFQEFEIASDEELAALVSCDTDNQLSFTFLLKEDYEKLIARIQAV